MKLKGKGGKDYELAQTPFAQGGEGMIYNIVGVSDKVAKLYKQGKMTADLERKLIKMVDDPPSKSIMDQIAWPKDVLYQNGRPVGFLMDKFQLSEELNVIYEYGSSSKYPHITWGNKIHIAKNLCVVLEAVHEAGYVCGDLNPKNINLNPNTGEVTFVDTDSYHITDGKRVYRCNVGMPEYLPPEIQKKMQKGLAAAPLPTFSPETDNFALAIHIFQLLMNGCHPFSCKIIPSADSIVFPDISESILNGECPFFVRVPGKKIPVYAPPIDILPDEIQILFRRAFIDGHATPSARPSAERWYYALEKLEKNLVRCVDVPEHEYFKNLSDCPWCRVDARYAAVLSGNSTGLAQTPYSPVKPPVAAGSAAPPVPASPPAPASSRVSAAPRSSVSTPARKATVRRGAFSGKKKRKIKQNVIIVCTVCLTVVLLFGASFYIFKESNANERIENVNKMISKLPEMVSDYSMFGQDILSAYNEYMELKPEQQDRIEDAEKLIACMEGFNSFQVQQVRQNLREVSEDSVQNTDILEILNQLYDQLTQEQRALLTKEENQSLEQLAYVYATIQGIRDLMDDVIGKYDTLPAIKQNYAKLTNDYYRSLVYNFSELDAVEEAYHLQTALVFSEGDGGWAVSVKADAKNSLTGDVIIPSEHQGQPVKTIPQGAFSDCAGIRSITIPDSVTNIGEGAFSGCIGLQSITLPFVGADRSGSDEEGHFGYIFGKESYSGGMEISQSSGVYWYNQYYYIPNQLKEVTITDAVQLGFCAFQNCSMLTSIHLNSEIIGAEGGVFMNCSGITTVNIPGILVINESMFEGCSSLTTLALSESVMRIEENAFKGCINLISLNSELEGDFVLGSSVQFIGRRAFSGCIQMQSITLPFVGTNRNASGKEGTFGYIFDDSSYSGGMEIYQIYANYNGGSFFYIPNRLKKVTITDAVQLGRGAFNNCSMLDQIIVNSGAKASVGDKAFEGCVSPQWD